MNNRVVRKPQFLNNFLIKTAVLQAEGRKTARLARQPTRLSNKSNIFILDACSLIALLVGEKGSENIKDIIQNAIDGKTTVKINQINLLEVYYFTRLFQNFSF